jgi:hypothetical protein
MPRRVLRRAPSWTSVTGVQVLEAFDLLFETRRLGVAGCLLRDQIDTYLAPNLTRRELHALAKKGGMNLLVEFGEACRNELSRL